MIVKGEFSLKGIVVFSESTIFYFEKCFVVVLSPFQLPYYTSFPSLS